MASAPSPTPNSTRARVPSAPGTSSVCPALPLNSAVAARAAAKGSAASRAATPSGVTACTGTVGPSQAWRITSDMPRLSPMWPPAATYSAASGVRKGEAGKAVKAPTAMATP